MSARWFYKVGEGEIGPVDVVEVERLIKNGRLGPEDRIRDEESDLFRAVRRVPRFAEILPKTVVKSRLEAAELEEVKGNPKLRHRANTKAAKNTAEAADIIAHDFEAGKYEVDEREVRPLWQRREFVFTVAAMSVLLVAGGGYLGFVTVRQIKNQQAYDLTETLMNELVESAEEEGPTSTRFRAAVASVPEVVAEVLQTAYREPGRGAGDFVRRAARAIDPSVRAYQSGTSLDDAFEQARGELVKAKFVLAGRGDQIRDF